MYGQKKGRIRLEQALDDHKNQVAHLEAHHEAIAESHALSVKEHLDQINKHKGSIAELVRILFFLNSFVSHCVLKI